MPTSEVTQVSIALAFSQYIGFSFSDNQTILSCRYNKSGIWPWIAKINVATKVKIDGHI